MTLRYFRWPRVFLAAFNPRKPLSSLAIKLLAVGMANINKRT